MIHAAAKKNFFFLAFYETMARGVQKFFMLDSRQREQAIAKQLGCSRVPLSGGDVLKRGVEDIYDIHILGQIKSTAKPRLTVRQEDLDQLVAHASTAQVPLFIMDFVQEATTLRPASTTTWVAIPIEKLRDKHWLDHLRSCM